jgi:hypothetical protein
MGAGYMDDMTRLLGILTLITALIGLTAPSVSLGLGVRAPIWVATSSEVVVTGLVSKVAACQLLGGKRVLPCHPDLGVLATPIDAMRPMLGHVLARSAGPLPAGATPEAELPPPRLG